MAFDFGKQLKRTGVSYTAEVEIIPSVGVKGGSDNELR